MVVGQIAEPADLVVIGAGPGGYAAALRAAQLGREVILIDREGADGVGGVCLRVGCIPSKALIEAAELRARLGDGKRFGVKAKIAPFDMTAFQKWKSEVVGGLTGGVRGLLKAAGVEIISGDARFTTPDKLVVDIGDERTLFYNFRDLILATGSRPVELKDLPFDGDRVLDSTGALDLGKVPKTLAVVGAGYVGLELGIAFAKLGSTVTLIEAEGAILPTMDRHLARPVERRLKALGVSVRLKARATGLTDDGVTIEFGGAEETVTAEKVIVAVGRRPNTDALSLDMAGFETDERGLFAVAPDRRLARHVAAIGDITDGPALAHKATAEGIIAAEALSGKRVAFQPTAIPAVVYSDPEIATAGLSAERAAAEGIEVKTATVPLTASGRAAMLGAQDGFIQLVADAADERIVGVHIVGPHASDLIGEGVLAIEMGATLEDMALSVHAHPTLGEQYGEAAHLALGQPIHMALRGRT